MLGLNHFYLNHIQYMRHLTLSRLICAFPRRAWIQVIAFSKRGGVTTGTLVSGGLEMAGRVDADHAGRPERAGRAFHFVAQSFQSGRCRLFDLGVDQQTSQDGRSLAASGPR